MGSDKENAESSYKEASIIYQDIADFDLGKELDKLKEENKTLLNHISCLEDDVEKLATALLKLKSLQENLTKNISSLYMTAKTEIERKDRIIADLRRELDDLLFRRIGIRRQKRKPDEVLEANSKKAKHQDSEDCIDQQTNDVVVIEEDEGSSRKLVEKNVSTCDERSRNRNTREVVEQRPRYEEFDGYQDHERKYRDYRNRSKSRDRRKQYNDDHVQYRRDEEFQNRSIGHRYNNFENNRYHRTDHGENKRRSYRSEQNIRWRQNRNTDEDEPHYPRRVIHYENDAANIQNEVSSQNEHTKSSSNHDPTQDYQNHEDKQATKSVRKKLRVIHKLEKERDRKQPNPRSTSSSENIPSGSSNKVNRTPIEKFGNIFSDGIHDIMDTVLQEVHEILPREKKPPNQYHKEEDNAESSKSGKPPTDKNKKSSGTQAKTERTKEADLGIKVKSHSDSKNFDYSPGGSRTVRDNIMKQSDMECLLKQTLTISHSGSENNQKGSLGVKEENNKEKVDPPLCDNIKQLKTGKENACNAENDKPSGKSSTNRYSLDENNDVIPRMNPSYKIPKKDPKSIRGDDFPDKYNPLGECSAYETPERNNENNDRRPGHERFRDGRSSNRSKSEGRPRSKSEGRHRSRSTVDGRRDYRGRSTARIRTSRSRSRSTEAHDQRKYHWSRKEAVGCERLETSRSITRIDTAETRTRSLTPISNEDWILNDRRGRLESPDDHIETYHKDGKDLKSELTILAPECKMESKIVNSITKGDKETCPAARNTQTSETDATGDSNIKEDEEQEIRKTRHLVEDTNTEINSPIIPSRNMIHTHSSSNQPNRVEIINVPQFHRPPEGTERVSTPALQKYKSQIKWKIQKIEEFVQFNNAAGSSSNQYGYNKQNQQEHEGTNIYSKIHVDRSNCETTRINEQDLLNKEPKQASEPDARIVENCRQLTLKEMGITAKLGEQDPFRKIDADNIKLKDIPAIVNQYAISQGATEKEDEKVFLQKQKSTQSKELIEKISLSKSKESEDIAKDENERKLETNTGKNQDTMSARNVISLPKTQLTETEKLIKTINEIITRDDKKKKIDNNVVDQEGRKNKSEELASHAYKNNSPVDSNRMIGEKLNAGGDISKTQIDNVNVPKTHNEEMKDERMPILTKVLSQPDWQKSLDNYRKKRKYVPCLAVAENRRRKFVNSTADSSELKSSKDSNITEKSNIGDESKTQIHNNGSEGENLLSKDKSPQNNHLDINILDEKRKTNGETCMEATSETNSSGDLATLVGATQPKIEEKCFKQNIKSRDHSLPILTQTTPPEKLTKPTSTPITPSSLPKKQIEQEKRNKTTPIAEEERKRKLETVIKNISKRRTSEAKDTTIDGEINTGDSKVVNVESQERISLMTTEVTQPASEAKSTVKKDMIKETPIGKVSVLKKNLAKVADESADNPSEASEASGIVDKNKVAKNVIKEKPTGKLGKKSTLKKNIAEVAGESAENPSKASGTLEDKKVPKETPIRKPEEHPSTKNNTEKAADESAENRPSASGASGTLKKKVPKNPTAGESSASKDCTPNKSQEPTRKRITPIPVKDSPICSFENILVKNQSPFSSNYPAIQVSPLTLTHEGDIPVLHLDENHFCNLRAEGQRPVDSNIMSLLDQMNISNMDCDITKFESGNEKDGAAGRTPANFENAIQAASVVGEKEVRNDKPPGGQSTPLVRRRRRCRLVVLNK